MFQKLQWQSLKEFGATHGQQEAANALNPGLVGILGQLELRDGYEELTCIFQGRADSLNESLHDP